ncbi:MAG: major capsid protein [Deferribacterales bacterium]
MPFPTITRISDVVSARKRRSTILSRKAFKYDTPRLEGTRKVRIDIKKSGRKRAPLVTPLTGNPIIDRTNVDRIEIELPVLGGATETTAEELFKAYAGKAEVTTSEYIDVYNRILDDSAEIDDAITRTEEYMAAEALKTGGYTLEGLDGSGGTIEVAFDFLRDPELTVVLSGTSRWGQSGVSAYKSLSAHRSLVQTKGGLNPNHFFMGETAMELFLLDDDVQKLLDNRGMNMGQLMPDELDGDVTYMGFVRTIGHIYKYTAGYADDDGFHKYIPDNGVAMFSDAADNRTYYGGIAVNVNDTIIIQRGRRVVYHNVTKRPPITEFLDVNSSPLLVLGEPDTTGYMEV